MNFYFCNISATIYKRVSYFDQDSLISLKVRTIFDLHLYVKFNYCYCKLLWLLWLFLTNFYSKNSFFIFIFRSEFIKA